jgi:hypothetical protein
VRSTSNATELTWFRDGPLGLRNFRRQLGRAFVLCTAAQKSQETLLFLGATQNRDVNRLDPRADGDAAASLVQISCTYEGVNEQNAARPLQIRGTIAWGTDGHQCVAEFDWLNGTIVQVSGSFIKVSARIVDNFDADDVLPTHDPLAAVRVGATIGYWAASRLAPTFTQQIRLDGTPPLLAPVVAVAIPRFARRVWILGPTLSDVDWAIGPAAGQEIAQVDAAGVNSRQAYERPGCATHLVLTGNPTVTLTTLTWELVL